MLQYFLIAFLAAVTHLEVLMSIGAVFHSLAAFLEKESLAAAKLESWLYFLVVLGLTDLSFVERSGLLGSSLIG